MIPELIHIRNLAAQSYRMKIPAGHSDATMPLSFQSK